MRAPLRCLAAAVMLLPLAPPAAAAPVPAMLSMTDDWNAAEHYFRDPAVVEYRGKLYLFWEGDDPSGAWPGYHGNLYYRTYEDAGGVASLGDVFSLTPTVSPFAGEHRNEKVFPVVFKDRLYAIWSSADPAQVPGGDVGWVDILVKSFDGASWSEPFKLNAPLEPYERSERMPNQYPCAAVLGDKLYIVWERNVQGTQNGVPVLYSDIWMRACDGERWDPPIRVSEATQTDYNEGPTLCVFQNKLYIAWEQVYFRDIAAWSWKMLVRTFDGDDLDPVVTVAISSAPGYKDSYPRMVAYDNPMDGRLELYMFWRVMGVPKGTDTLDAAIAYAVFDGAAWSGQRPAAPIVEEGIGASGIGRMSVAIHDGSIHLAWATTDDYVKAGKDYDIALRSFDGSGWGPIIEATSPGDESQPLPWETGGSTRPREMDPSGLPTGFSQLADWRPERISLDNDPRLIEYEHRLYVTWRVIPDYRYYGYMSVYLKVAGDYDTDGDDRPDTQDVFPDDPADWADTDGDGVGDNTDPAPYDPDIWLAGQKEVAVAQANPAGPLAILLMAGAAAAYFLRPSGKGKSPAAKRPPAEEAASGAEAEKGEEASEEAGDAPARDENGDDR